MKVKYVGKSFGVDGLINGNIYEVVGVDEMSGYLSVIDESGEDYLYHPRKPKPIASKEHPGGKFEIVEDNDKNELHEAIFG